MQNYTSQHIKQIIAESGPISFAEFMQYALYTPSTGYYMSNNYQIGKKGDFHTAPEISAMFGHCIANQINEYIRQNNEISILELGPGSGKLAKDILENIKKPECIKKYLMLELSPSLKEKQKETTKSISKVPISHISKLPTDFKGIIIANEVIDAMPVHRFKIANKLHEQYVELKNNELIPVFKPTKNKDLIEQVYALNLDLPLGYESEINLALPSWINSLSDCLKQGIILLIDYGYDQQEYYHPERNDGTLKCFHQQKAHNNPFINIGSQDITAHVDFTKTAKAALKSNLEIEGYVEQAHFLLNLDLINIAQQYYAKDPLNSAKEMKLLTMPSEMGSLCKVLGLSKGITKTSLAGFCNYNKVESLFRI
ncbi:MAG: SAM-dependent methyltransferase [Pseudomonadota bacterium]|nr:SAM-dependent methyltransferase [Pseudomonadota bacterium]